MPAAHALEHRAEAAVVKGLEQVIDGAHFESFERVVIVGRYEHDERQGLRIERARQRHARQRIHLDVEEQQVRRPGPDRFQRRAAVTELTDHHQIGLAVAALAHRAPRGRLVIDDDDVHERRCASACAAPSGPSRSNGMWISATQTSPPRGPALKTARSPNCTARRSRTLASPIPAP